MLLFININTKVERYLLINIIMLIVLDNLALKLRSGLGSELGLGLGSELGLGLSHLNLPRLNLTGYK